MNWNDIKSTIGGVAPLLGSAIGGPAGASIGALISNALGVENKPEAVDKALRSNPDALLALKKFEFENEADIRKHVFLVLDSELKDIQNARESHKHNPMPMIICIALTAMVAGGAYMLFTMDIPPDNKNIANLLFGTVLGQWGSSIAYWVGTTRSSSEKNRLMK